MPANHDRFEYDEDQSGKDPVGPQAVLRVVVPGVGTGVQLLR